MNPQQKFGGADRRYHGTQDSGPSSQNPSKYPHQAYPTAINQKDIGSPESKYSEGGSPSGYQGLVS